MKVGVIMLILLLSTMSVRAELFVSCSQDSDCALALSDDYSCIEASCVKADARESAFAVLEVEKKSLDWNFVDLKEKEGTCRNCLSFAPEEERNSFWLLRFFRFVLYL
ncbi:MAG: hypothetical protein Q8R18_04260 [bacterium]|nr:hypothetical protein [bacterium]